MGSSEFYPAVRVDAAESWTESQAGGVLLTDTVRMGRLLVAELAPWHKPLSWVHHTVGSESVFQIYSLGPCEALAYRADRTSSGEEEALARPPPAPPTPSDAAPNSEHKI